MTAPVPGLAPTQTQIQAVLVGFIAALLPDLKVVIGQQNRVAEPSDDDFIVLTPWERPAISTSVDSYSDCRFTASISGTTMTVTAIDYGELGPGLTVFGVGVEAGTKIVSGAGGTGAYEVDKAQDVDSEIMAAGVIEVERSTKVVYMLDAHGESAADHLQTIVTAFRDLWGVDYFINQGNLATPLCCDDPRQLPFLNENQQIENRWGSRFELQANPVLTLPQQFADKVDVARVPVDAFYPAS